MGKSLSLRRPSDIFSGLDNFFNRAMSDLGFGEEFELDFRGYPRLNVYDNGVNLLIEASVPGLTSKDVRVDWQNGALTICGQSVVDKSRNVNDFIHRELHQSNFCRSLRVDQLKFDVDKIEAKVENGLLTVNIPRKDVSKFETKQIEVK